MPMMGGFPQGNPYMMPPQDQNFSNPFMMEQMKKDVNPNLGSPSQ